MTEPEFQTRVLRDLEGLAGKMAAYIERTDARISALDTEQRLAQQHRKSIEKGLENIQGVLVFIARTIGAGLIMVAATAILFFLQGAGGP